MTIVCLTKTATKKKRMLCNYIFFEDTIAPYDFVYSMLSFSLSIIMSMDVTDTSSLPMLLPVQPAPSSLDSPTKMGVLSLFKFAVFRCSTPPGGWTRPTFTPAVIQAARIKVREGKFLKYDITT